MNNRYGNGTVSPSGILFPEEFEGTLVTEAVRGEGGKLINNQGEIYGKIRL